MPTADDSRRAAPFPQTDWSVIRTNPGAPDRRIRLERLFRIYWQPVYWYIRCKGRDHETSKDLTQAFVLHCLEHDTISHYEGHGRFRGFLMGAIRRFLLDDTKHRATVRHGAEPLPLDEALVQPEDTTDPERAFDHEWLRTIYDRATRELLAEPLRDRLRRVIELYDLPVLAGRRPPSHDEIAAQLRVTATDIKNDIRASRRLIRGIIRRILLDTVESEEELERELAFVFGGER